MRFSLFQILFCLFAVSAGFGQTTEFTYQGKISDSGTPTATYDFEFRLCATANDCSAPLGIEQKIGVAVTGGIFSVKLNFGTLSAGERWLEIAVKRASESNFTTLTPRQKITSAPNAVRSLIASDAENLGGIAANQYVLTTDPRLDGSNYVRNSSTPQAGFNFNISGTGTANVLNAATQFNLGGQKVLSNSGTRNLFAGINAGNVNTGSDNAFFGYNSGQSNSGGNSNSFFGSWAGQKNTIGGANSFFGTNAGSDNTSGSFNSFFGNAAGLSNSSGSRNSFFGESAGVLSTYTSDNTFVGWAAGFNNVSGSVNTFLGGRSGINNTSGSSNTFIGYNAGQSNSTGATNTFVGTEAGTSNLSASGNSFFGFQTGSLNISGIGNSFFGIRAGSKSNGNNNSFFGAEAGRENTTGQNNAFFGTNAGFISFQGSNNTFIGSAAGYRNTSGSSNVYVGYNAGPQTADQTTNSTAIGFAAQVYFDNSTAIGSNAFASGSKSTAIGANAVVSTNNTIVLGTTTERTFIPGNLRVQDNGSGAFLLDTVSLNEGRGLYAERLYFGNFSSSFSPRHVCSLAPSGIAANGFNLCSSAFASANLKSDITSFSGGLEIVKRLNPVSFTWNVNGEKDFGLLAEDVAEVAPQIAVKNAQGDINDVSEGGVTVVLINAVKEQQKQIERLTRQNENLSAELAALKKLFCQANLQAEVCLPRKEENEDPNLN